MFERLKITTYQFLRWSEKYTKTDMVYLTKGSFWNVAGQVTATLASLGLAVAMAKYVPKELYGNYKYLLSLAAIIGSFSLTGIATALTQAVARGYDGELKAAVSLNNRWSFGIVIISFTGGAYYLLNDNYTLAIAMFLIGVVTPLLNSFSFFGNFLNGKKLFRFIAFANFWRSLIPAVSILILVLSGFTNPLLLFSVYVISNLLVTFFCYRYTKVHFVENNKTDPGTRKYSFQLTGVSIVSTIADQIDKVLVFQHLGGTELAVYSFATAIPMQIRGLMKNIYQLALPSFSKREKADLKKEMYSKLFIMGGGIILIVGVYIIAAPYIFKVLFPNYTEATLYSQVFALSLLAYIMVLPAAALQAKKAVREMYEASLLGSIFKIILIVVPIFFFGLWGVIAGKILFDFFTLIILMRGFKKYTESDKEQPVS